MLPVLMISLASGSIGQGVVKVIEEALGRCEVLDDVEHHDNVERRGVDRKF